MGEWPNYHDISVKSSKTIMRTLIRHLCSDLVSRLQTLYLAEGKKRTKLWVSIEKSLEKLEVPKSRIDRVVASDDAQQLATLLQELWG